MSFTLNEKIINARQGDEKAGKEIESRLKTALIQCLDTHTGRQFGIVADSAPVAHDGVKQNRANESQDERKSSLPRLPTSALVNRMGRQFLDRNSTWQDKIYFYRIVSELMRQALRDFFGYSTTTGNKPAASNSEFFNFKQWDNCIKSLSKKDKSLVLVLEMYYMGGMSYEGIATALSLSIADVDKKLRFARAWICRELVGERA